MGLPTSRPSLPQAEACSLPASPKMLTEEMEIVEQTRNQNVSEGQIKRASMRFLRRATLREGPPTAGLLCPCGPRLPALLVLLREPAPHGRAPVGTGLPPPQRDGNTP